MRIITWNIRKAKSTSPVWEILNDLNPDLILLQEALDIPQEFGSRYRIEYRKAINKNGKPQIFGTAILVKGEIISKINLSSEFHWVNQELDFFDGNIIGCVVKIPNKDPFNVISVYSPAWPVSKERLSKIDVLPVKLKLNDDVWCTEILWSGLKNTSISNDNNWVIGGDFNSSETFDYLWKGGPRGNKEIIERMNNLGLKECLRSFNGELTPTFRNPKGGKVIHQMDHLYVSEEMFLKLTHCAIGDNKRIFDQSLSDHLPIIADFE